MLVLFDIDGTLILTGGAGFRAIERAWADLHGRENGAQGIPFDGKTDPLIVEEMFAKNLRRAPEPDEVDALIDRYVMHLHDEVARTERYRIMPGVEDALVLFEQAGATIGLATGNVRRGAEIKLARGDLWRRFAFGGYGCDSGDRGLLVGRAIERGLGRAGRSIPREDTFVIGDTPRDVRAPTW
jgi:phosphoglycolate phosphatase-like HAD superfamily hydrolase